MTTTASSPFETSAGGPAARAIWLEELGHYLRPDHFPARLDQVLATLARHRAPSHLYWRLASLPLSGSYAQLQDLVDRLAAQEHPHIEPEPL